MKKVKIAIALLSLVALVGFNLFVNLTDSTDPSTLLLDNVEALADGEIENYYNFKLAQLTKLSIFYYFCEPVSKFLTKTIYSLCLKTIQKDYLQLP